MVKGLEVYYLSHFKIVRARWQEECHYHSTVVKSEPCNPTQKVKQGLMNIWEEQYR